jgi:predicted XRE-type DNA-binding protein
MIALGTDHGQNAWAVRDASSQEDKLKSLEKLPEDVRRHITQRVLVRAVGTHVF